MTGQAPTRGARIRVRPGAASGRERAGLVLALLCLAQFMVILDTSIVNVALPAMRADLGFTSQAQLQYVISLYALTFGGSLILAGRVADLFGRRRLFIAGFTILLAAGLLLSGVSPGGSYLTDVLPGFALTGLGLGLAFVAVTIAATRGVDDRDQGLASGVVNSAQQVGYAVGIAAVVTAALVLTNAGGGGAAEHLVAGYSAGYLLDTALAALGVVVGCGLLAVLCRCNASCVILYV